MSAYFPIQIFYLFLVILSSIYKGNGESTQNIQFLQLKLQQLEQRFKRDLDDMSTQIGIIKTAMICQKDWSLLSTDKCVKIFDKLMTEKEAEDNCRKLDSTSTLITIHSHSEQELFSELLNKNANLSDDAWIGLKFKTNETYEWVDNSEVDFENWEQDAIKDGLEPCVQMSLENSTLGKWRDENCDRKSLVICQKIPLTKTSFKEQLDQVKRNINVQDQSLKILTDKTVPVGFIYTQFYTEAEPAQLWPNTHWIDISEHYSGLFFRAEGDLSLPFGQIQQANYSHILNVRTYSICNVGNSGLTQSYSYDLRTGWSDDIVGTYCTDFVSKFQLFTTNGTKEPSNAPIKLWMRLI